jgi:hypothetical protein
MNNYNESDKVAFDAGVQDERARIKKIFDRYHQAICHGVMEDHPDCEKSMSLKYIYEYLTEKQTPR